MPQKFLKITFCLMMAAFLAGCGVTARSYIDTRDRVDQQATGNAGYLVGEPSLGETTPTKTTRKIYVLEFTKDHPREIEKEIEEPLPPPQPSRSTRRYRRPAPTPQRAPVIPVIEDDMAAPSMSSSQTYTVKKSDTLQKISKKFYGGYSKWPKIYEANKDKIKNPNRIKPGITITIPAL